MFIEGFYNIWYLTWVFFYSAKSYEISEIFGWENRGTESLNSMQVLIISEWVAQKANVSDSQTCAVAWPHPIPFGPNFEWTLGTWVSRVFGAWNVKYLVILVRISKTRLQWSSLQWGPDDLILPMETESEQLPQRAICLRVTWRWWCFNSFLISVFSSVRVYGVL